MIKHIFLGAQAFNWEIWKEFRSISSASGRFSSVTSINSVTPQSWTIVLFSEGKMEGLGLYYYLTKTSAELVCVCVVVPSIHVSPCPVPPRPWLMVSLYHSNSVDLLIPQQGSYCDILKVQCFGNNEIILL